MFIYSALHFYEVFFSISNILILGLPDVLLMVKDLCLIYGFPYRDKKLQYYFWLNKNRYI